MHDFAVKDLMVPVLPEAAQECPKGGSTAPEECDDECNTCKDSQTSTASGETCESRAAERDFKVLDRELRQILDQS